MARTPTAVVVPPRAPAFLGALLAAAVPFDPGDRKAVKAAIGKRQRWQEDAWDYFDEFGFIKYGLNRLASDAAAVRLFATLATDDGPQPIGDVEGVSPQFAAEVEAELAGFASPDGGQSELIRVGVLNVSVAGEFFLIPAAGELAEFDGYLVRSTSEVAVGAGGRLSSVDSDGKPSAAAFPEGDRAIRVYRRHGRRFERADSSMLGILADAETALIARSAIRAALKSRVGAGIVTLPDTMRGASGASVTDMFAATGEGAPDGVEGAFEREWRQAFTNPVANDGSPSAVAPMPLIGAAEDLAHVQWIEIGRKVDPDTVKVYEGARVACMQGLDFPVEVVTGVANMNHWGAFQITESMWVAHGRPAVAVLAHAALHAHLRPRLLARNVADAALLARLGVGVDDSGVLTAPPSREDAIAAADRGAIGQRSLRTALRFDASDAVNDDDNPSAALPSPQQAVPLSPGPPVNTDAEPITAAALPPLAGLGSALAAADRAALSRLAQSLDDIASRALDRAGARIRSRATGVERAGLDGVPNWRVPQRVLGLLAVGVSFALDDDELLDGAADDVGARFELVAGAAQRTSRRVVRRHTVVSDDEMDGLEARQDVDRGVAAGWLTTAFLGAVRAALRDPGPATTGEWAGRLSGAPGLAREALARAGGAHQIDGRPGLVANGSPALGAAAGQNVLGVLADHGVVPAGFVWQWGGSDRPFPPHEDLDGVEFGGWDDSVLAIPDGYEWIGVEFLHPGDHQNCSCSALISFATGGDDEEPNDQ